MNKLQRRNVWMGSALALIAGMTIAPGAIALPEVGRTSGSAIVIAQALDSTTATVVDVDPREDTVRLRLANGNLRMFSLSTQEQQQLGLASGVQVMLTMSGDRIITMTRMVSVMPAERMTATVIEVSPREDRVRVRLADGSIRLLSLPVQEQSRLGLRRGSEVTVTSRGNRIDTMIFNNAIATVTEQS